ncbi:MAG: Rpn family recombination-promoting nuclease/putative transposase [Eubacteriales bacterium]|nr:Rpn family recombination-promoting nuclease/putative transposase [Eubacteriales bacterium]
MCRRGHFIIIAVELQDKLHYYMPLRCLEYDLEDLHRQLRRLQERYDREGGLAAGEEFLSGIKETDRLIPVITILLYHGAGKWTAARQLSDLPDLTAMDEPMKKLAAEYRLHVINLTDLNENKFESGLRELIGTMKRKDNKKALLTYCRENKERFSALDDDTYDLICTMLHMKTLKIRKEENRNPKEDTLNMCKAIEDLIKDSKEEGAAIGRKEGRKEGAKAGEERLSTLILRLAQDDRMAEALSAAKSVRTRRKLYREYGI